MSYIDRLSRTDDFISFVETNRVLDPSSAAVRVMTVHQAKGLEFDVVVLPELATRLIGQPKPFVAGRPQPAAAIDLVCRYCDEHVQQLLPPQIRKLFDAATHQAVSESLCLLYVALTRAVHALHMIVMPSEKERNLPKTYAGLLRAALTDGAPLTDAGVVYRLGDQAWHAKAPAAKVSVAEDAPRQPAAVLLAPPTAKRHRGLERASPSSLEGGRKISLGKLLQPGEEQGFAFGTLIHAWLEQIEWLDDGEPEEQALRRVAESLAAEIGPLASQLAAPLAAFRQMLAGSEVRRILSRPAKGADVKVLREHPFVIRDGDRLLSGNIDRLVLTLDGGRIASADVIDYKTDALPPGDDAALAAKVDFYRPQLAAYCRAVEQLYKLPPERVTSTLVFLTAGKVVPLDGGH
ncbi:MAG TPA: PD-(D/E)XK nuclease family protein [Pirellulaceae bacterium]|nr:PD-(D/E)XK nuclease family protein [Pirellulaceae bacterium]